MNWKEIFEKYPKGHNKYAVWERDHYYNDGELTPNPPIRDLYDFFDENDLFILMELVTDGWFFTIKSEADFTINVNGEFLWFKTRTEAEQAAFTKAFEILESKLQS